MLTQDQSRYHTRTQNCPTLACHSTLRLGAAPVRIPHLPKPRILSFHIMVVPSSFTSPVWWLRAVRSFQNAAPLHYIPAERLKLLHLPYSDRIPVGYNFLSLTRMHQFDGPLVR